MYSSFIKTVNYKKKSYEWFDNKSDENSNI